MAGKDALRDPILNDRDFTGELHFSASRSSGPGGQNVNKVNTQGGTAVSYCFLIIVIG